MRRKAWEGSLVMQVLKWYRRRWLSCPEFLTMVAERAKYSQRYVRIVVYAVEPFAKTPLTKSAYLRFVLPTVYLIVNR